MRVTHIIGDCPGCGGIQKFGNVIVRRNHLLRGCLSCQYSRSVPLPHVRKKILYLDQFFFSSAFHAYDERFVEAARRISNVSALQLLAVPFSSVHEDEANQWKGYSGKNRDDLMKFIKMTSRGHKFESAHNVELTQINRAFKAFLADAPSVFQFHEGDAVKKDIHTWDDYVWIDVGRYIGDVELMRELKQQSVEKLIDAFENWRQSANTFEEQVAIELREAAKGYIRIYSEYAARLVSGDISAVYNAPVMSRLVESLLHCLPPERIEDRMKKIAPFLASDHFKAMPYLWLTARIYASLKDMVKRGAYKDRADAIKRFSGFFQDVKHVATYAPYCDAFVMDKAMASLAADPRINLKGKYGVKVFTVTNWDEFLAWLSELEAAMSPEHREALSAVYP
jgi:hypothetical protein